MATKSELKSSVVVVGSLEFPDEKVMIVNCPSTETDDRAVPVGVNFVMYQIPRGMDVHVAYPIYEALKNAVQMKYIQKKDGIESFEAPQYSHSARPA
ncbi:hypothetical protein [Janthinobacterium sp. B9-8]|uniref:hypothetical protein n=1 Tax=Janthinobacterium sp. B9-8 TaxID=1236179 RepID=UPI00061D084E|nr:hypothetical protein [Janthinobacterium sp. B9-8]AMC34735.1 hypothetical protein VN23_08995 [Janthinobacterium sp. B9-8]